MAAALRICSRSPSEISTVQRPNRSPLEDRVQGLIHGNDLYVPLQHIYVAICNISQRQPPEENLSGAINPIALIMAVNEYSVSG